MARVIKVIGILSLFGLSHCGLFESDNLPQPTRLQSFKPSLKIEEIWAQRSGYGADDEYLRLIPAVDDGQVFVVDRRGYISAFDCLTGRDTWYKKTNKTVTTGVVAGNGLVLVGTADAKLTAYRQSDGKKLWTSPLSNELLALPTISGRHVYTKSIDGTVLALDSRSGRLVWQHSHQAPGLILRASSSVAADGANILAGYADGKVELLTSANGTELWQSEIAQPTGGTVVERMVDIDATPIISRGVLYVATYQGLMKAIRLSDKRELWQRKMSSYTGMALGHSKVYITDADDVLWAISKANGRVLWKQVNLKARGITAPTLQGRTIVLGDSKGYLHYISAIDGRFLGRVKVSDSAIFAPPVVAGNAVYVHSTSGRVVRYDTKV